MTTRTTITRHMGDAWTGPRQRPAYTSTRGLLFVGGVPIVTRVTPTATLAPVVATFI